MGESLPLKPKMDVFCKHGCLESEKGLEALEVAIDVFSA